MDSRPINIEFVLKGDLEQEVDKVRMSVKRMGTEGARSYRSLFDASNEAFNAMSTDAKTQAVTLQKVITQMKSAEQAQASLKEQYEAGKISGKQYAESSARLSVQQANLKSQASSLSAELQKEIQLNNQVEGSYNQMVTKLKQLKETYKDLSAEERNNDEIGGKMLQTIKSLESETGKFEESLKGLKTASATSIDGMKQKLSELEKQYNSLSAEERKNKDVGGKLRQEMKGLQGEISKAEASNRSFVDSLEAAPGPIGQTVSGLKQMIQASLRFIATPLGAIIAAIVLGIKALTTWFRRGSDGQRAFAKGSAYFRQILDSLLNVVSKVGEWLYKAFTNPKEAMKELVTFLGNQVTKRLEAIIDIGRSVVKIFSKDWKEGFQDLGNATTQFAFGIEDAGNKIVEFGKKAEKAASRQAELAEQLYDLDLRDLATRKEIAELDVKISDLRAKAKDNSRPERERLRLIKEAMRLRERTAQMEIDDVQERLRLTREQMLLENDTNDVNELTVEQQKTLNDLEVSILQKQKAKSEMIRTLLDQQNAILGRIGREKDIQGQIEQELKQKKDAYANYYKFVAATDKKTANEMFSELTKQGDSYLKYINNKINELESKTTRTNQENTQLVVFTSEKQDLLGTGDAVDALKIEIEQKKKLYQNDILAFKDYLNAKLKAIDDTNEQGYKQKVMVEVELDATDEQYKEQLNSLQKKYGDYTTKMMSLTKDYQEKRKLLEQAGTEEAKAALENLNAEYSAAVMELKNQNDTYLKTIFSDFEKLSADAIQRLMRQTSQVLDSAETETQGDRTFMLVDIESMNEYGEVVKRKVRMTVDEFSKLQDKYKDLEQLSIQKNPFKALADSFDEMIDAIASGDSEEITRTVDKFSLAMDESISMVKAFESVFAAAFGDEEVDAVMNLTEGLVNLGQGIAKVISGDMNGVKDVLAGIAQIYDTVANGAKKAREAEREWLYSLMDMQREYNALINEQIRTQADSGIFITDYVAQIKAAYEAMEKAQVNFLTALGKDWVGDMMSGFTSIGTGTGNNITQMLEDTLNELEVQTGTKKKKFLGITIGSEAVFGNLLDEYPDLITASGEFNSELAETILNMENLKDETESTLEDLVEYQSQINEAREKIDAAIQSMAGNIASDLHTALKDAWEAGTSSFDAFKNSVTQGLNDIVSQMLFNQIFSEEFEQLGEAMKESFDPVTGDDNVLDDFEAFLDNAPGLLESWEQGMTDLETAMDEAGFSLESMMGNMTGTTADSIADSIAQGFANGYNSAADFADNFEDMMKKAVLESFKIRILESQLDEWYQAFSSSVEDDTLAENIESLQNDYNAIIASASDYITAMEEATGLDFGVNQEADTGGSIEKVTEETASVLEGHFVAVRINTGRLVETTETIIERMAQSQLSLAAIEKNTNELARLEQLENILKRMENDGIKLKN